MTETHSIADRVVVLDIQDNVDYLSRRVLLHLAGVIGKLGSEVQHGWQNDAVVTRLACCPRQKKRLHAAWKQD
jgi:hypothetical protein